MGNAAKIAGIRRLLAEAQITERLQADVLKVAKADAEQRAIEAVGGEKNLGSNAEARDRALTIALADDLAYQQARDGARDSEARTIRLLAELEAEKDLRREAEWEIKERLFRALDYLTNEDRAAMAEAEDEFSVAADALADERLTLEADVRVPDGSESDEDSPF